MGSLVFVWGASLALLAALGWLFSRLVATRKVFDFDLAWWQSFQPDRYSPVLRLLSPGDFDYVAHIEGGDRRLLREFKRNRLKLMRSYVKEMSADFDRLQAMGQLMVTSGAAGRELREALFRERFRFTAGLWTIRLQMAGFRLGLSGVDARVLVGSLDGLSAAVRAQQVYATA